MPEKLSRENISDFRKAGTVQEDAAEGYENKHREDYTPEEVRDYILGLLGLYDAVQEYIEEEKEKYVSNGKGRTTLENAYSSGIAILQHIGIFFHPLSTYGSAMLKRARNLRKDFEKVCGPFTVNIDAESIEYFSSVLSDDIAEDVAAGKLNAIGAMRSGEDGVYGVGALAYYLENDPAGSDIIIRIKWLYVAEEYRERQIASSLLLELMVLAKEFGVAAVSTDISIRSEWSEVVCNWLDKWYYRFTTGFAPEVTFDVPENSTGREIKDMPGTGTYSGTSDKDMRSIYTRFLRKVGYKGHLLNDSLPKGYVDVDTSCYIGDKVSPEGMLLSHILPSGLRRVEYMGAIGDNGKETEQKLIYAFIRGIAIDTKDNRQLIMEANDPELYTFFDKIMPNPKSDMIIEGILMPLDETDDITANDMTEFLREE